MNLFFWRKRSPVDPLTAFEVAIERSEARAAQVRKAAAVLVSLQAELAAQREAVREETAELVRRREAAAREGDAAAVELLRADLRRAAERGEALARAVDRARADAEQLKAAARRLTVEVGQLRAERDSARLRLASGEAISAALHKSASQQLETSLRLDDARSEVERAHALAELYREKT